MLQCAPNEVEVRNDRAFGPNGDVSLREVGQVAYVRQEGLPRDGSPTLDVNATYSPAIDTGVFCYSTHGVVVAVRSEEHTSELQSLMRISYAVFCLKKKNT